MTDQFSFHPRATTATCPSGITVSKQIELPPGDFGITEYAWGDVILWFIDDDGFTADERQEAYEVCMRIVGK